MRKGRGKCGCEQSIRGPLQPGHSALLHKFISNPMYYVVNLTLMRLRSVRIGLREYRILETKPRVA